MGVHSITCVGCSKPFQWFSGNPNQFCVNCSADRGIVMGKVNVENKEAEYLEQIVKLQQEIIALLKAEVERLKGPTTLYVPNQATPQPLTPGQYNPFIEPHPAPNFNPLIVTCGDINPGYGGTNNPSE